MKRYFECEIKIVSRWQQVTINKWVIATEPNHLNGWFIQERNNIVLLLRDAKQCCSCLELFFVGEMAQKQAAWCLKRKSFNINLLFIELLYKILSYHILNFVIILKGIVHFEIKIWYLSAYPKGIQDVGVFFSSVDPILIFLGQTVLVCQSYNGRNRSLSL